MPWGRWCVVSLHRVYNQPSVGSWHLFRPGNGAKRQAKVGGGKGKVRSANILSRVRVKKGEAE
ncbi:hypothetical protein E2C01_079545 [Portunus trituberculatus]|uniref:Uncharacterized protein n=1 Tax=Portunus trituberculatus TaxID=210409 RepID=A0A5B7IQL4_PORTR|nr:hypothetical protein [Portunus trituberculatus]